MNDDLEEEGAQPSPDEVGPIPPGKSELDYAMDGYTSGSDTSYEEVLEMLGEFSTASLAFQWGQWAKLQGMPQPDLIERFPGTHIRVDGVDYDVFESRVRRLNPDED